MGFPSSPGPFMVGPLPGSVMTGAAGAPSDCPGAWLPNSPGNPASICCCRWNACRCISICCAADRLPPWDIGEASFSPAPMSDRTSPKLCGPWYIPPIIGILGGFLIVNGQEAADIAHRARVLLRHVLGHHADLHG